MYKIETIFSEATGLFSTKFLGYEEMKSNKHDAGHMTKMAAIAIYGINTIKILFPGTSWSISMKLGMKHQRFKLIIFCSNDNHVLILTYFTARSNFATSAFLWENVTMMDTLQIIASSDLEFGLLCKLYG